MAVAAKMLRMNADRAANVVKLLEAAQQNIDGLANVAPASAATRYFRLIVQLISPAPR